MTAKRILSDEVLEAMGKPREERAKMAIEACDKEKALKEIDAMYNEFLSMHNLLRDWVAALYTYIYKNYGEEALYDANHKACSFWLIGILQKYAKAEAIQKAHLLAAGLRSHFVPLKVEEDDEKFTLTMLPCGSGGKMALQGFYEPKGALSRVKKEQPQTFSKKNFPVYCTHCAFQEIISVEEIGYPVFITDCPQGDQIGNENCKVYIYKNPRDIPEIFFERIGKKKSQEYK
jgi:hypothetical protein